LAAVENGCLEDITFRAHSYCFRLHTLTCRDCSVVIN
jgi:hypothetical protein